MTADAVPAPPVPTRFRGAPERNARIARPLALLGRVHAVDEGLVDEIGRRMMLRDEVGAALAAAMRPGTPRRVTMAALGRALEDGPAPDDHPALRAFVAAIEREPEWLDRDLLERGAAAYRRMGSTRDDVLLALALIGGYRYEGPADLLVATGGLTGAGAMRRLGETLLWGQAVSRPGGMVRDGEGFRLTAHVRAMHAVVDDRFERSPDWDSARLGLPVNRSDLAGTLALFSATAMLGARVLGRRIPRADADAVMHLWRYVGFLLGVDEDWLFGTERAQHAFDHHLLLAQGGPTPAGVELTTALVEGQCTTRGGGVRGRVRPTPGPRAPPALPRPRGAAGPGAARRRAVDGGAAGGAQPRGVVGGGAHRRRTPVAGAALGRRGGRRDRAPPRRPARAGAGDPDLTGRPCGAGAQVKRGGRFSANAVNASCRSALGRKAAFQAAT